MSTPPVVYLFHGNDELAISETVRGLGARLGDPASAEMNLTRFAAPSIPFEDLSSAAAAMPFLAERRLVIVHNPGQAFSTAAARQRFLAFLDEVQPTTALVLTEDELLKKEHWLRKWAQAAGGGAFVKEFKLPEGRGMSAWLQKQAGELGGEIEPRAAAALAELIGSDTRAAVNEIEKLLALVNYGRPINVEDVERCSLQIGEQGDFFALIDAIGANAPAKAMGALRELLAEREPISLFFGLVAHFRLLVQANEIVTAGGGEGEVAKGLGIHPYRAKKLAGQARRFSAESLDVVYARLLDYDRGIKTGELDAELALQTFVAALVAAPAYSPAGRVSTSPSTPIHK